jgi:hypothetical protein
MSRPASLPIWATDTDYSAGSDAWSGQPNKVDPAGQVAQGSVPSTKLPAEWFNFLQNLNGQWLQYFADIQVQNWTGFIGPVVGGQAGDYLFEAPAFGRVYELATGHLDRAAWSNVGELETDWNAVTLGDSVELRWGAANDTTVLLGGVSLGVASIYQSTDGTNFTVRNLPGGFTGTVCGTWDDVHNLWIIAGTGAGQLATSPDGITWTTRTVSGAASSTTFRCCATRNNGAGIHVFMGNDPDFAYSDSGTSWGTLTMPTISPVAVVWNPDQLLWMAVGSGGGIAHSPDRITWTTETTSPYDFIDLAAKGALWVATVTLAGVTAPAHGIAYSKDNGASWTKIGLHGSDLADTFNFKTIRFIRNSFWAAGLNTSPGSFIYRSLRVGTETPSNNA